MKNLRIQLGMGHPAHIHFFKNVIWNLESRGHEVKIVIRPKKVMLDLVKAYNLDFNLFGEYRSNILSKVLEVPYNDYLFYKVAQEFKPDIFAGILNYTSTHIGSLLKKPSIIFTDTEHMFLGNLVTLPFSTVVCTPSCFKNDLGSKHLRYNGYHELAYLHPKYFEPDPSILNELGLSHGDKLIVISIISWEASHDTHSSGLNLETLENIVNSLSQYGKVLILSDVKLNKKLEQFKTLLSPEKLHSALYYSTLYFGEGGTTAVEASLLGTPAVHVEAFKSSNGQIIDVTKLHGNFDELVNKYGLLYTFSDQERAFSKAIGILEDKKAKIRLRKRRDKLLRDKIDVTDFVINLIENYPESYHNYLELKEAIN